MASAVFNLYERLDEMKKTLDELDKNIERDSFVLSLLNNATEEDIKKYELNIFMDSVKTQIETFKTQREKLDKMICDSSKVLELYESDKDTYNLIITKLLTSFGFSEDELN